LFTPDCKRTNGRRYAKKELHQRYYIIVMMAESYSLSDYTDLRGSVRAAKRAVVRLYG